MWDVGTAGSSRQIEDSNNVPNSVAEPPSKRVKQLEELLRKVSTEVDSNRQTDHLQNEIKVYEALQCPKNFMSKMDTLRFWKCRSDSMSLLSKLACAIFSVPASAADVEKTWSAAGLTVNKRTVD